MTRLGRTRLVALAGVLALATACGSGFDDSAGGGGKASGPLQLLFGSSGTAETNALKAAGAAFTKQTGIKVTVTPAQDLPQQVAQGFAANKPPDVFYLDPSSFQNYAKSGDLYAYADKVSNPDDFYPVLKRTFTYKGRFTCVPKDWGTTGMFINTRDWKQAGLTDADVPTNWSQLERVLKKLTTHGRTGLVFDAAYNSIGQFFYQNGGSVLNADGTKVSLDSRQNIAALSFLKKLMKEGVVKWSSDVDAKYSGEAFGKNKAAMVMSGPFFVGALAADYPHLDYKVYKLPAGPAGPGTLSATNCWGIPAQTPNKANAVKLVNFLASAEQQMKFAKEFGPIPARASTKQEWSRQFPTLTPFIEQADYAHPDIALPGGAEIVDDFASRLSQLNSTDPAALLAKMQSEFEVQIKKNNG